MDKLLNILILSVGRRKRLVDSFLETLQSNQIPNKLFVADAQPELSPVCASSKNVIKLPYISNPSFKDTLISVIEKNEINIVIPTIDTELDILSSLRNHTFKHKYFPIISDSIIINQFRGKKETETFFKKHGILTPEIIVNPKESDLPLFAKLQFSSSSIGAQKVESASQLNYLKNTKKEYVFQQYIEGEEFTIDFFVSKENTPLAIVPRKRLEVRGGEVSKGITIKDVKIIQEVQKLTSVLSNAYGPMCVQVIKNETGIYFIEINPRFGGGYPLTYQSGVNFMIYILNDYNNMPNKEITDWKENMLMLRYDHEVIVNDYNI